MRGCSVQGSMFKVQRRRDDFLFEPNVELCLRSPLVCALSMNSPGYFPAAGEDLRRRISPILMVSPSRSKYSKRGIVYLRLEPIRSRNDPAVISPFSERNFLRTVLT